jgi:ATP-dependent DNA ligase
MPSTGLPCCRLQKRLATRSQRRLPNVAAPEFVPPMRAIIVQALPAGDEWMYEVKWDGYRALALKHGSHIRLLSLKNKNLATDFPAVMEAVRKIAASTAVLDGEIVAVNQRGQPSFQALQNRASLGKDWLIDYYAFDLLNVEGEDLRRLPLEQRRLAKIQALPYTRVRARRLQSRRDQLFLASGYGLLRHATFLGLRDDKVPSEVIKETANNAG